MKLLAFLCVLLLVGCGGSTSVTLRRFGGFSGMEERYKIDQDGNGTRSIKMPVDSESKVFHYTIDKRLTNQLVDLVHDRWPELKALDQNGTGNMTSGLIFDLNDVHKGMTWPNIDPPKLNTPVLDSVYHLMLQVEQQMTTK